MPIVGACEVLARIGPRYPAGRNNSRFGGVSMTSLEIAVLKAFGLPIDLPETTNGKTTITDPVVLPKKYTETLDRVREERKACRTSV